MAASATPRTLKLLGAYSTTSDGSTLIQAKQCGGAMLLESVLSRENLRDCISLNINYLFSPLGYAVQSQYIGEMVIVLKV